MNKPIIYISTCDSNSFILKYFQYFFQKYWANGYQVRILGFQKPDIEFVDGIEFISLAPKQEGGAANWSTYLYNYFKEIPDEIIIFGLDDFVVARPVDFNILDACYKSMTRTVGRIDLQPLQYARDKEQYHDAHKINDVQFIELAQSQTRGDSLYRISAAFSMWNKEYLLKYMKPGLSPWQWELNGSQSAINDGYQILGTKDKWAVKKVELLSDVHWPGVINVSGMREDDIVDLYSIRKESDRAYNFSEIYGPRWGYYEKAGPDWIYKIFGE